MGSNGGEAPNEMGGNQNVDLLTGWDVSEMREANKIRELCRAVCVISEKPSET